MSRFLIEEETLNSLLAIALKNSPIKEFEASGTLNNTLYIKILEIKFNNWLLDKLADNTEMEIKFSIKNNILNVSVDLYGAILTIAQNLPLLDNIILFLCPKLSEIKGLTIKNLLEIEVDLNVLLKNIVVNKINIYKNESRTVYIDFTIT